MRAQPLVRSFTCTYHNLENHAQHVAQLRIKMMGTSCLCPSPVPSSNPLTILYNHCVFSVIFRELARVGPLYDTVNFNCLGLRALTPVQPPEGTRELTETAYGIERKKKPLLFTSAVAAAHSLPCSLGSFAAGPNQQCPVNESCIKEYLFSPNDVKQC